jgi:hypothetical protein
MPSQLLHVLFGEDVFPNIPAVHRKAFALGCQGPDIFYHSQGRRPVGLEYGTLLHRRGIGIFTAEILRRCRENDALRAYALGFMTHAILDRHAHPYIVYKSEVPRFVSLHAFFERIIDVLMLKFLRGTEITSWDQEGLLAETCENPPLGLKELLAGALIAAFPERAGKDEKLRLRIENAFLDCAGFYRLTSPASSLSESRDDAFSLRKHHLVYLYPLELPGGIDFLNLGKQPWYSPAGGKREDRRSFPEIYAGAVAAAAGSFTGINNRYRAEGVFPFDEAAANAIGETIGNGGLNIVDENGKPCAPCRADPLPLEEILERQAALYKL